MSAYYNEIEPSAVAWLRELIKAGLIADGIVDDRSITEVQPDDLRGFTQCHFFAGIGGWSYALRLAGWPDGRPVWTGSCPCQPFSNAGKRRGTADERHLWPTFFQLIKEVGPPVVFGEQVASAEVVGTQLEAAFLVAVQAGEYARANKIAKRLVAQRSFSFDRRWLDGISADLETAGYSVWSDVLGAHSVGAPHIRQRLYWMADAEHSERRTEHEINSQAHGRNRPRGCGGIDCGMADAHKDGRRPIAINGIHNSEHHAKSRSELDQLEHPASNGWEQRRAESIGRSVASGRGDSGLGNSDSIGQSSVRCVPQWQGANAQGNPWSDYILIPCRDGKARRIKPGLEPLAHGISGRVGLLRGYGNAICPETAATFIRAYQETAVEETASADS